MERAKKVIMLGPQLPRSPHHHPAISKPFIHVYIGPVPDPLISITTTSLSRFLSLMASLLHQLSLVCLLFLASSSFQQIHARESRFMKVTRPEDTKEATPIPEETSPAVKKEDPSSLPPLQSLSGSGYGLYGHGQERFTPATTTSNNNYYNYNNARPNTELASENYENKYNGGYNHANQFKYPYNRPSKFSNEEFNRESYETTRFGNVDTNKQYGLSDTRFLDNGRYFYDVNADRSRYRAYTTRGNTEAGARGGNYGNGVYGNGNSNYEYSNTMGGYQNNQANQESQEEYVP